MNKRALFVVIFALSGCSLAPEFQLPEFTLPEAFKTTVPDVEQNSNPLWQPATPLENERRGQWWKMFGDEQLNALQTQALEANQSLRAAHARVEQARSIVRANASSLLPQITIGGNAARAKSADASTAGFGPPSSGLKPYNNFGVGAQASYEVDLFARVLDTERALTLDADAQEALYHNMLLALQADVATHYFRLRALDAERALLRETVTSRTEAARIMQRRYAVGAVGLVDVARAEADLASVTAELIALDRARGVLENALAVLLGQNPSSYQFAENPSAEAMPPLIPAGLPSQLLLRRPDVSAAQSAMAAANRRVGVARTAFFPRLILTATGGFESTDLSDVLKWSSRSWALGQVGSQALSMTLFDNGRNAARVDGANAAYEEAVANWRQASLTAFGEVENALSAQATLAQQTTQQQTAANAASEVFRLTQRRYAEGDADYFEVITAQRDALALNRAFITAKAERMLATVSLIRALGGGWDDVNVCHPREGGDPLASQDTMRMDSRLRGSDENCKLSQ